MPDRISTGIPLLDPVLGGGYPTGSLVCLLADSMSNADVFLYHFAAAREVLFFVTDRRAEEVGAQMRKLSLDTGKARFLDGARGRYLVEPELSVVVDALSFDTTREIA